MTTVIVTGGRDFKDALSLAHALFDIRLEHGRIRTIVQGGASGADDIARRIAEGVGVRCVTFEADWKTHGRAAGPIRNRLMLEMYPEAIVLAMPGGRGTDNCVNEALRRGMRVVDRRTK